MPEHGLKPEKQFQIMWSLHAIYIIMFVRLLFELFFFFASRIYFENFYIDTKDRQTLQENYKYKYWQRNLEQNISKL